jgi:hypothetical protein
VFGFIVYLSRKFQQFDEAKELPSDSLFPIGRGEGQGEGPFIGKSDVTEVPLSDRQMSLRVLGAEPIEASREIVGVLECEGAIRPDVSL